ncbi:helix-turn-helix transcriptional regulator [Cytobacillus sp. IB215316]|uniref:helix-turn-helix transcriptional regulator n=1 Tax=Cytobacillus sp. IB215316 TaxID=3097354 RepID=UPI002A173678|nr:WYL domain-containing protein [Cytobacillus sp. IB215316]MDX8362641.1 WYL domain-containing protein [Cytobacillus sp. IB215316]
MKRADRLMAILIALQHKSETAQSLADKFEVSKRTILRDMQALSEIGIPLYSMTGPSGGFHLMDGYQLPPLQFDVKEGLAILFALRAMTKIQDTPFNQERWTALDKIKAIIPDETLEQIDPILNHVELEVPNRNYKTPLLMSLLEYTVNSQWLNIKYRSKNHHRWVEILPKRVYTAHGFWYCEAYSHLHKEDRIFRVDRMDNIEVIESTDNMTPSQKPSGKDTTRPAPPIRVIAKLTYQGALQLEQDPHIGHLVKNITDNEWEIDYMCPATEWNYTVNYFFSLGLNAHVIEPEAMRNEIFQLGQNMCYRYSAKKNPIEKDTSEINLKEQI